MRSTFRHLIAGLTSSAVLLLTACGGGGGGSGEPAVTPPTAVAKPSQTTAAIGTDITLDGSGSTTPNGGSLSYTWVLSAKPDGSVATLSDASAASPTLKPDKPGDYVIDLVVKDSKAGSTAVRVTITVTNPDPVAVITTPSQVVLQGGTVTLDGSASLPPTGAAASDLRYEWKLTAQPDGTITTVLVNATSAKASFTANKLGVYRATLTVRHGDRVSATVQAEVSVNNGNSRPVTKTSVPTTVVRGSTVVLDGSGSTDADGDELHYRWSFAPFLTNTTNLPKPRASTATISNATSAKAEFVPDAVGKYYIDLIVYDKSVSATERVIVDVTKPAGASNIAPTAVIGNGLTTEECEIGGYCGQGSSNSYDADGDALSATWTYWNAATPNDKHTESGSDLYALSYLTSAGTWQVQLVVNDGQTDSAAATQTILIKTGANVYPIASAKVDTGTVLVGESLNFDASASTDRNGDQLSYEWVLYDRPDGSAAELKTPTAARSSVVTDKPGLYRARVKVTDSKGAARPFSTANFVQGFAKAQNNAPVVANLRPVLFQTLSPDQPLVIRTFTDTTNTVRTGVSTAFVANIFDPDLDSPLYYIFTATKYPAGGSFTRSVAGQAATGTEIYLSDTASATSSFLFTQPGDYEFQMVVSDGSAYSETKTLNFSVVTRANYPGVLLETSLGQFAWPHNLYIEDTGPTLGTGQSPREMGSYTLYAADRDYTISNLATSSTDASLQPYFEGLQNGQVIRQGETVAFRVMRPPMPDESALMTHLYTMDINSEAFKTEQARLQALYQSYRFTWAFQVPEQSGRTFYFGPRN